jgi:hypothetical protein
MQHTIIRARRAAPGGKLNALVVGASLAGTLLGWAVFAGQEAQDATIPAVDATQAVAPAPTSSDTGSAAGVTLPDLGSLWAALTGAQTAQAGSTDTTTTGTTTSAAVDTGSTGVRTAFTTTQSSR